MRALHQRGVDKPRSPDPGREQVELSRSLKDLLIFLCRSLWSIHVLEDATTEAGEG